MPSRTHVAVQSDLFAPPPGLAATDAFAAEPVPPEFVQRIRDELHATLALAREADALPWADLTQATLAELRFDSIADWLPFNEGVKLRQQFAAELDRLYAQPAAQSS